MSNRISLSRAARLVGTRRGTLQKMIQQGELKSFDGDIDLTDLLQAFPDAEVEDTSMLERVGMIMEQASFVNPNPAVKRMDNDALASRVYQLSQDLAYSKRNLARYESLLEMLLQRFEDQLMQASTENESIRSNRDWLSEAMHNIANEEDTDDIFINNVFLRVMSAQATVIPSGHEFFIEGSESILEAALRGGLAMDYGCSNGNCGKCKVRIISGEIRKIRHHDYQMSEAEKGLGFALSCACTAVSDVVIEAREAQRGSDIPLQSISTRIKKTEVRDDILLLNVKTPRTNRLRFLAGQTAELSIEGIGKGIYPIASCPCDDMNLQFHIELQADDALAKYLAERGTGSEALQLEGPRGDFSLRDDSPASLVFIAEGIGFASIKGLIEHAMSLDVAEEIILIWVADHSDDFYLNNLCRAWQDALDNFHLHKVTTADRDQLGDKLSAWLGDKATAYDYYVCAGAETTVQLQDSLQQLGVPKENCVFEEKH